MKQLIIVTPPYFFSREAEILTQLFRKGMTRLHIRKPACEEGDVEELIRAIPVSFHQRIVLHDHFRLAGTWNLYGIHLNSRNREIPVGFTGSISRSCHSINELADITLYNYVFLSPIFQSISKESYLAAFPMDILKQAADEGLINEKVIALGGINQSSIPLLDGLPFAGVAILGALWGNTEQIEMQDVLSRFRSLQQCITNCQPK